MVTMQWLGYWKVIDDVPSNMIKQAIKKGMKEQPKKIEKEEEVKKDDIIKS